MDTTLVIKPIMLGLKLLSMAVMAFPLVSHSVSAEEFLCDATQASTNELPVLDKSCPIGKGLWGNQKPKGAQSSYWIQCGVLSKPLSLAKAKSIYQHISTDVWSKPEDKGYRCLIGPYDDFSNARTELAKVKTEPEYKEAFIREVTKSKQASNTKPSKDTQTNPAPKKERTVAAAKPSATVAVPVIAPVVAENSTLQETRDTEKVVTRLTTTIDGLEYRVPYTNDQDGQFYMEHGLPWNRLDYTAATEVCDAMSMRLPLEKEWETLLAAEIMLDNNWPMHLPYWGYEKKGLFTSGKVSQLKGTSLLNVVCVK